jgi:putative protein kinase ArgK-like GTPase of G3E family
MKNKPLEQSRMSLVTFAFETLEQLKKGDFAPALITFWGSKGMGKTTLLENMHRFFSKNRPSVAVQLLRLWRVRL